MSKRSTFGHLKKPRKRDNLHMQFHGCQLLNFRINPTTKKQFQHLCRSKQSNMTSELNQMIYDFISKHEDIFKNRRPLEWSINIQQKKR